MQRGTGKLAVAVEPHPVDSDQPTPRCCRTYRFVIVSYGGVADIRLSSYSPIRRSAAAIVSLLFQSATATYMNCPPQSQADWSRQSTTAACTRCAPVTSGKYISGLSIRP